MKWTVLLFYIISHPLHSDARLFIIPRSSHLARRRQDSYGLDSPFLSRRSEFHFDPHYSSGIIGSPGLPSHLPEAEPVLPGHTLLRPALGMLKSAVKFPHRDLENGAGVYGNIDNLSIRYDGQNERVLYTGFRRSPSDYIMVVPTPTNAGFQLTPIVLDLDKEKNTQNRILEVVQNTRKPKEKALREKLKLYILNFSKSSQQPKPTKKKKLPLKRLSSYLLDNKDLSADFRPFTD